MRRMTEEQARTYIRAGYFPKPQEIDAICDLQDVFGNQTVEFVLKVLYAEENAETLFRLIWSEEDVDRYMGAVDGERKRIDEINRLEGVIKESEKIKTMLKGQLLNLHDECF